MMSDLDRDTSIKMQIPIYGVDAMSRTGKPGKSVNIHRVNPDGIKYTNLGKTIGNPPTNNSLFDIVEML